MTLEILYRKMREERDAKIQIELESLEKRSEEKDVKLQIELEAMLDKKIRLYRDIIQNQIEDGLLGFKS